MATKKKMLQAAAGNAGGGAGGVLNVEDVFSTYLYEGNGSSQVIENGIRLSDSNAGGSVEFNSSNSDYLSLSATSILNLANDYTIEMFLYNAGDVNDYRRIFNNASGSTPSGYFYVYTNGTTIRMYNNDAGSLVSVGTFPANDWFHLAISRSGSTTRVFINGTQTHSYTGTTNFISNGWFIGGGPETEWSDIKISSFRVVEGTSLYTSSFTPPTSDLTDVTNTALLTCQGPDFFVDNSSNSLTITKNGQPVALNFGPFDADDAGEGGLVWFKNRSTGGTDHNLYDTERGDKRLRSNSTGGELDQASLVSVGFNSNGFSLNASGNYNDWNASGEDYASWTFRKASKFFTCVTWTGDGTSNRAIPHDLGGAVGSYFVKCTSDSTASDWIVWHKDLSSNAHNLVLNTTAAQDTNGLFSTTAPDSSNVYLGTSNLDYFNATGRTYVAYIFAHNDGDGEFGADGDADIIKCGSFTGTGAAGNFVDLGFEPQWLLLKNSNDVESWWIFDNMRGAVNGGNDARLMPNVSNAESSYDNITFSATGFTPSSNNYVNGASDKMIYIAIRRGTKVPESATEVFEVFETTNTGTASTIGSMGPSDFILNKRTDAAATWRAIDRLRGGSMLRPDSSDTETSAANFLEWDKMEGVFVTTQGAPFITNDSQAHWMWKRAPGYFDAVAYEGNGVFNRNVQHNLQATPELIIVKGRDIGFDWMVYSAPVGFGKYQSLNSTIAASADGGGIWGNSSGHSDTTFQLGNSGTVNGSGNDYIAYLFASLDGVSKVGSYTGTGSDQNIDCGFTSGARFVLIKRYSSTSPWSVFDSVRGITSSTTDPYLFLNSDAAEATDSQRDLDPYSSGFKLAGNDTDINASGSSYIFYAIA